MEFLKTHSLKDPDDLDALIELADYTRDLVADNDTAGLNELIRYTVENRCHEALSWILGILAEGVSEDFLCPLGRAVPGYDGFVNCLEADPDVLSYEVENEHDEKGEIRAISTIYTHGTKYGNIFLVTSEMVDNLDQDYIEYRLLVKGKGEEK